MRIPCRSRGARVVRTTAALALLVTLASGSHQNVFAQTAPPVSAPTLPITPADPMHEPTLYVVTYSHLDTEWCWTYRHSILEYIPNTLRENFVLFDRFPSYTFNWTGASRYRFAKDYYPDDYARLKTYVAAGRWIPTGSAWDENDALVPAPESIIRSILYSNRWFQKEFGKTSIQYMMPDTFGFPASLPTILAHSGLKGFSTKKLTYGAGAAVGVPFNIGRWIGPDGQSVVAALNPGDYRTRVTEDLSRSQTWLTRLQENGKRGGVYADYMYHGNGDLGGSPGADSAGWLEKSLAGDGPVKVRAGSADDFFRDMTPDRAKGLPEYQGDLLLIQHSAGSINSGAAMKRWNHRNERLADAAERAAVTAHLLGGELYPTERLTEGWLRFLGGQMHDILPGTSLPAAYELAWNDQIIALNQFADVTTQAVGRIAQQMDTQAKGIPLVVYNPVAAEREEVVTAEIPYPTNNPADVQVYGPNGKAVLGRIIERKGDRATVEFLARVPSVGFAVFDVRPIAPYTRKPSVHVEMQGQVVQGLENDRYRVRLDKNGDIDSIFDKESGREMLSAPLRLAFLTEKPKQHPAWNMDWDDRQKPPAGYVDGPAKITVLENGPARASICIEREARGSRFRQIVRLAAGEAGNRVEFQADVDWHTSESSLKAVFPLAVSAPEATYNWGIGTVRRGNNDSKKYEVPSHEWFDLTEPAGGYGVSVLNEAKYGSDKPDDNTLRLTLLYTPGVRDRFQHQATQDWGHHQIRYALEGHKGDWRAGRIPVAGAEFNQPLQVFQTPPHTGKLGRSYSLLRVDTPGVMVAALKKAEDSDEVIVRLFERTGKPVSNARLTMATPILKVREVNGQEQQMTPDGRLEVRDGAVSFEMKPYRPRAFALTIKPSATVAQPSAEEALTLPFNTDVASSGRGKKDGAFDAEGRSYPGERFPALCESGGVTFHLPAGGSGNDAVSCAGQKIELKSNATRGRWLYLLASAQGDVPATLNFVRADGKRLPAAITVQNWDGYIGQWDTRVWKGTVSDQTAVWPNELAGITPGFIKQQPVAWYSDHRRLADGNDDPYRFCYLFRYAVAIPEGVVAVELPNESRVRIFAATLSSRPGNVQPAAPLYDDLPLPK